MPGRTHRSERVVLCDDVSWSEPAPRGRRAAAELDPPSWTSSPRRDDLDRVSGYIADAADDVWMENAWEEEPRRQPERADLRAQPSRRRRSDVIAERHEARALRARKASGYRVEDYWDESDWSERDRSRRDAPRARTDVAPGMDDAETLPVVDYTDAVAEEEIWGPRPRLSASEPGGRRTVVITGRGSDRYVAPRAEGHGAFPLQLRHGFAADRTAMWAVLLCVIVLLVALGTH